MLVAIFIIIAVPQFNNDIKKVELFWIVIIGLYGLYTFKHSLFLSKLCMQFNTFLENNLYKEKFNKFLDDSRYNTFFDVFFKYEDGENIRNMVVMGKEWRGEFVSVILYGFLKLIQIAIIPGLLSLIIYLILDTSDKIGYIILCYALLLLISCMKLGVWLYIMLKTKNHIKEYITKTNTTYDQIYDAYHNLSKNLNLKIGFHMFFSGGDSAFSSYLFTKTFTLIFGILMFIIGIPVYSIVSSITLLYIL